MQSFKTYLREQKEGEGESHQVKHLTHIEDRALQTGSKGTEHAMSSLNAIADHIKSGKNTSELTTKYDGSPALVYGHHPKTGKFFVASKSAFNKEPKINYNEADVDKNHGHAPGLANKLKQALKHLKKTAPKQGVYQGDMMFSDDDIEHKNGVASFHPNPSGLTYHAHGNLAKKAKAAKIGVVTHLKYNGEDSSSMKADHNVDRENFKEHPDVFTVDPRKDTSKVHFSNEAQKEFEKHMKAAKKIHDEHGEMYAGTDMHQGVGGHLETYINHTVRTGETPNHENFKKHLETKYEKMIEKLKSEKGKNAKKEELKTHLNAIEANKKHYNNLLKMHGHLQKAKGVLLDTMNQHEDFEHTHHGEKAEGEGYVFHHKGQIDKLVDRAKFSRRNFAGMRNF